MSAVIKNMTLGDVTVDCREPEKLRDFYAGMAGWERRVMYDWPAAITDSGLVILFMGCDFEYVPPVWPEKPGEQQKQMHFNFGVDDLPSAVEESIRLGAKKAAIQYGGDRFVTMTDPEGHPFCLCGK